jgi:predicted ATPase
LLQFSVLYGIWVENQVAFNGNVMCELAAQFIRLAEKHGATVPLMVGHRLMGTSLLFTGDLAASREHFGRAMALYDPGAHRPLAAQFGQDVRLSALSYRSNGLWVLGWPDAALADTNNALKEARESGQATTLAFTLSHIARTLIFCGDYAAAMVRWRELSDLADKISAPLWRSFGTLHLGSICAATGKPAEAIQELTRGLEELRLTETTIFVPFYLSQLALVFAEAGQFDDAQRCIDEAMTAIETTQERWCEAEVNRIAGEIALKPSQSDVLQATSYFERALAVARQQQAKSWELRAAMSMARLWRDQGKRDDARDLLAPVYGWFTEGFDTLDLKQAKVLLEQLDP